MQNTLSEILIVDDDRIYQWTVEQTFKDISLQNKVHYANNGEEALQMLKGENGKEQIFPDVIFLDINMPRLNGHEFLKEIRQDKNLQHLIVYMMSSSEHQDDINQAFANNAAGYFTKPLDIKLVFEQLMKVNKPKLNFKFNL